MSASGLERRLQWRRVLALGGGLVLVAALCFLIPVLWFYLQFRGLDAVARSYAEAGFSLDFEDYRPAPVAEEDNAQTHYQRAGLQFQLLHWELTRAQRYLVSTEAEHPSSTPVEETWDAVETFLREAEPGFAQVSRAEQAGASAMPFPVSPHEAGDAWETAMRSTRLVPEALSIRGRAAALRGDTGTVIDTVASLLAMAERLEHDPQEAVRIHLFQCESAAWELLAVALPRVALTSADFGRLESLLDFRVAPRDIPVEILAFETSKHYSLLTVAPVRGALEYTRYLLAGVVDLDRYAKQMLQAPGRLKAEFDRHLDLLICLRDAGLGGHDACTRALESDSETFWGLDATCQIIDYIEIPRLVRARLARVAVAIHRYRAETGDWPEQIGQLADRLPPGAMRDMYRDADLVYRRVDERFTLYSVGWNGTDDGGRYANDEPWPGGVVLPADIHTCVPEGSNSDDTHAG